MALGQLARAALGPDWEFAFGAGRVCGPGGGEHGLGWGWGGGATGASQLRIEARVVPSGIRLMTPN